MTVISAHDARRLTAYAVQQTVDSLPSPRFALRLVPAEAGAMPVISRIWRRSDLCSPATIGWLRKQNRDGYHIFFRPPLANYIVVDDLSEDALDAMAADGLRPHLVVETSPHNHQAWIAVARNRDPVTDDEARACAHLLAERYEGDPGAASAAQFGRLPGFRNRKPMHESQEGRFPLVMVRRRRGYGSCYPQILEEARAQLAANSPCPPSPIGPVPLHEPISEAIEIRQGGRLIVRFAAPPPLDPIDTYYQRQVERLAAAGVPIPLKCDGNIDRSRLDFLVVQAAIADGIDNRDLEEIILASSKKCAGMTPPDAVQYARRTLDGAVTSLTAPRRECT